MEGFCEVCERFVDSGCKKCKHYNSAIKSIPDPIWYGCEKIDCQTCKKDCAYGDEKYPGRRKEGEES